MTRDEFLNIPEGRELDALIAEHVMGWVYSDTWKQLVPFGHADPPLWSDWEWDVEEMTYTKHPINMMSGVSYHGDKPYIPEYSTNICEAWKVVEKLSQTYRVVVGVEKELSSCKIFREVESDWKHEMLVEQIYNSAPLAVCRAALLLVLDL